VGVGGGGGGGTPAWGAIAGGGCAPRGSRRRTLPTCTVFYCVCLDALCPVPGPRSHSPALSCPLRCRSADQMRAPTPMLRLVGGGANATGLNDCEWQPSGTCMAIRLCRHCCRCHRCRRRGRRRGSRRRVLMSCLDRSGPRTVIHVRCTHASLGGVHSTPTPPLSFALVVPPLVPLCREGLAQAQRPASNSGDGAVVPTP